MRELTIVEALREALAEEMSRDPTVFLMGEDIGRANGVFNVTAGLQDEFGKERVIDTPISEAGFTGMGIGAALTGMRPVIEILFCDFMTLAMDQIVNQAAKLHYMTGGQAKVPIVIRTLMGAGRGAAAQHSQSLHAWVAHIPGLKVVMPSTPYDAKGLLKSAIRDDNPVIFFEDKMSYQVKGLVPVGEYTIPLGVADVKRVGSDVTFVATSSMVQVALAAADVLAQEGISAEVVDPRTLKPLDKTTILESVKKTGRVVIIDEGHLSYGVTAEIAAIIADEAFDYLDAPVKRLGAMDVPVPMAPVLEQATVPNVDQL
ncbi:MAG: alpha-ketoacid dehydrogenase subunit beta, partial [Anaerolineae bacterium]|nr:alpha-ketoacid dehydrogenase subunit beta [Anaerolineae bacterium]